MNAVYEIAIIQRDQRQVWGLVAASNLGVFVANLLDRDRGAVEVLRVR